MTYSLFVQLTLCIQFLKSKFNILVKLSRVKFQWGFWTRFFRCRMSSSTRDRIYDIRKKAKMCMYIIPIFVNQYIHRFKLNLNNFDEVCGSMHLNYMQTNSHLSGLIPSCFKNMDMELCLSLYISVIKINCGERTSTCRYKNQ